MALKHMSGAQVVAVNQFAEIRFSTTAPGARKLDGCGPKRTPHAGQELQFPFRDARFVTAGTR